MSAPASAWPEARSASPSRKSYTALAAALGLAAAAATFVALPTATFRARAVLAVADVGSPLSMILSRNAAESAVSKPVMTRAAESLIGTGFPAPEPDLAERAALAAHLGGKATGKVARLAAGLPRLVTARPGEMPGTLDIVASHAEAERSAQAASAVAEALIAGQDDTIAAGRRRREADAAARIERLKGDAAAARRQLAALGGDEADPAQMLAMVAARTARAQLRVDTIRAIIASGSPPLSDRRDVPSAIETLQTAYLDLASQLAKARETLGDRHTTIISLNAELRHAASSLTAEWRRLGKLADAELAAARDREARLRQAAGGAGVTRRDSIDDARRKVQLADEAVGRALSAIREPAADERGYRLVLRPMVPNATDGFSLLSRLLLAGLAGALALGLAAMGPRLPRVRSSVRTAAPASENVISLHAVPDEDEARHDRPAGPVAAMRDAIEEHLADHVAPAPGAEPRAKASASDTLLKQAMVDLLPRLETIDPAFGPVPTVMVAANEVTADVSPVALALGRAAAANGHRVLLIEATRSRPEITAAVEADAEPILVDYFGTLRVALRAPATEGALFVAPNLQQGARIASALARQGGTPLVDDIGVEFDLVVIDGGRGMDAAAGAWGADAYLRVGRHRSQRDDDQFAATFGVSREAILGAVAGSSLSTARSSEADLEPAPPTARPVPPVGRAPHRASAIVAATVRHAPPRRRIVAR